MGCRNGTTFSCNLIRIWVRKNQQGAFPGQGLGRIRAIWHRRLPASGRQAAPLPEGRISTTGFPSRTI